MEHPEFQTRTDSDHLPFALCSLFLPFSSSQIIYINRPFCGCDCRSKGWMHEENGILAIALCRWFVVWVFSLLECLCRTSDLREVLRLGHSYAPSHAEQHRLQNFHLYCRLLLGTFNLILPAEGIIFPWWKFTACILDSLSVWFPGLEISTLPLPNTTHLSREPSSLAPW